ncbi:M23 family metallopeptidase [Streptomyces flavofungini]|uniref:M23 family metallopeptidase n=1 Tax=Streptomyces flavofungini TaxID=68200 RepID=UPI0025B230C5|nr:M23 family metallopeptidase [Streptomyces flavofungini]WJV45890.1 M23 family metallopeptidase [Streptomyces flavofungini]
MTCERLPRLRGVTSAAVWVTALLVLACSSVGAAGAGAGSPERWAGALASGPEPPPGAGRERVPVVGRDWPVGVRPLVVRGWEPPASEYGPGHRGVDLAAAPGSAVRAVAPGRVSFAGRVGGRGVVSVELSGTGAPPLRTTYEPVRATVRKGTRVTPGEILGTVEPAARFHCPTACVHWGLLREDTYLNPLSLLPPWLLGRAPSRLLPLAA